MSRTKKAARRGRRRGRDPPRHPACDPSELTAQPFGAPRSGVSASEVNAPGLPAVNQPDAHLTDSCRPNSCLTTAGLSTFTMLATTPIASKPLISRLQASALQSPSPHALSVLTGTSPSSNPPASNPQPSNEPLGPSPINPSSSVAPHAGLQAVVPMSWDVLLTKYGLEGVFDGSGNLKKARCRFCMTFRGKGYNSDSLQEYTPPLDETVMRKHVSRRHRKQWEVFILIPGGCGVSRERFWSLGSLPATDTVESNAENIETSPWYKKAVAVGLGNYFGLVTVSRSRQSTRTDVVACRFCCAFGGPQRGFRGNESYVEMRCGINPEVWCRHINKFHYEKWTAYLQIFEVEEAQRAEKLAAFWAGGKETLSLSELAIIFQNKVEENNEKKKRARERKESSSATFLKEKVDPAAAHADPDMSIAIDGKGTADAERPTKQVRRNRELDPMRWVGRRVFQAVNTMESRIPSETLCVTAALARHVTDERQNPAVLLKYLPGGTCKIDKEIANLVLHGLLFEYGQQQLSVEQRGFLPHAAPSGQDDYFLVFDNICDEWNRSFGAVVLFYLLSGTPTNVLVSRMGDILALAQKLKSASHENQVQARNEHRGMPYAVDGGSNEVASVVTVMAEPLGDDENADHAICSSAFVTSFGNCICAEAMMHLKSLLDNEKKYWGIGLHFRACDEVCSGGVEVMICFNAEGCILRWVHLVSLRHADGVGEAIVSIMDCVCVNWRRRLIGVNSDIDPDNHTAKITEKSIADSLQRCVGPSMDLLVVGRNHLPESNLIHPSTLAQISQPQFVALVQQNKQRLRAALDEAKILQLPKQRELLKRAIPTFKGDKNELCSFWREMRVHLPDLATFADGLLTVWQNPPWAGEKSWRTSISTGAELPSNAIVDAHAERVFWARAYIAMRRFAEDASKAGPAAG